MNLKVPRFHYDSLLYIPLPTGRHCRLEKHWVKEKERFSAYAVNYVENNKALDEFKAIYWKLIQEHIELTAKQVADYYKQQYSNPAAQPQKKVSAWTVDEYKNSVEKYLETVILREKARM